MARINYQALRGTVRAYAPAQPPDNPHLWVILDAGDKQWFATPWLASTTRSDPSQAASERETS